MNVEITERLAEEADLWHALATREFVVYYQPQVVVGGSQVIGVEALVRWQHPNRGLILPGEFIPMAEEIGLIGELDQMATSAERACYDQ